MIVLVDALGFAFAARVVRVPGAPVLRSCVDGCAAAGVLDDGDFLIGSQLADAPGEGELGPEAVAVLDGIAVGLGARAKAGAERCPEADSLGGLAVLMVLTEVDADILDLAPEFDGELGVVAVAVHVGLAGEEVDVVGVGVGEGGREGEGQGGECAGHGAAPLGTVYEAVPLIPSPGSVCLQASSEH